jgi:hypothetical protein
MNRTVTALYDTKAQAERVRDALVAAHLGDHVEIRDQAGADKAKGDKTEGGEGHRDIFEWLGDLFSGHPDTHVYGEGLRRGHVLLTATVEDFNEIRAAELLDADAPVDLNKAQKDWRAEGWAPRTDAVASVGDAATPAGDDALETEPVGVRVRVYAVYA